MKRLLIVFFLIAPLVLGCASQPEKRWFHNQFSETQFEADEDMCLARGYENAGPKPPQPKYQPSEGCDAGIWKGDGVFCLFEEVGNVFEPSEAEERWYNAFQGAYSPCMHEKGYWLE